MLSHYQTFYAFHLDIHMFQYEKYLAIYSNHDYNKLPIYACFGRLWEMKYRPKN